MHPLLPTGQVCGGRQLKNTLFILQAAHNELRAHGKAVAVYRFFATFSNLHFLYVFYTNPNNCIALTYIYEETAMIC